MTNKVFCYNCENDLLENHDSMFWTMDGDLIAVCGLCKRRQRYSAPYVDAFFGWVCKTKEFAYLSEYLVSIGNDPPSPRAYREFLNRYYKPNWLERLLGLYK